MSGLHVRLRASVAVSLIVALLAPPTYARGKPKAYTWSQAQNLKKGTAVILTVTGSAPVKVQVWYVADVTLVTSTATPPPEVSGKVKGALKEMGANWGTVISGNEFRSNQIRVSPDGVFDGPKKVAELAQVVQFTARDRVVAIEEPAHNHTLRWAIIGVAVAFAVSILIAMAQGQEIIY